MPRLQILSLILALVAFGSQASAAEVAGFDNGGTTIKGDLFLPQGAGPFPAVVALHGCGGLYAKDGALSARHAAWAKLLTDQGFIVLFPDSFGSRGLGSQCRVKDRDARAWKERVGDVLAAKKYLQTRPDVKAGAISLLGWSNGATTVINAVKQGRGDGSGAPDFAKAVAFYPGCRALLARGDWHPRLPLLILIGEADDWTPAEPCKTLAATAAAAGEDVKIVTYPGAYHDFDHPHMQVRLHHGLAYTAAGTGEAHAGTNDPARQDAIERVPQFLAH